MSDLCKKCGLCCKLIPVYQGKMLRDSKQEVFEFLIPLTLEEARKINEAYVNKVQNFFKEAQFFTCKYLSDNNLCTNPDKPQICKDFPISPCAFIQEECGYIGEIFLKHEKLKQKIRRRKEEIIHYEALIRNKPKEEENYQKIIDAHCKFIVKYTEFGSAMW